MTTQKDLVTQWQALGYRRKMASETVVPPPPKTFIRAYHMMQSKWALTAIRNQRLKVSRFADLNDPFELLGMNRHTLLSRKVSKGFRVDFNASTGVLCFGADWSSPVMWSHYADKHKGIYLGFDIRRNLVHGVVYEDQRLRVALGKDPDPAHLDLDLRNLLSRTKAKAWEYEEELRMFIELSAAVHENPRHFCSFSRDVRLAEVILGERCEESLDSVRTLLAKVQPDAVAYKARLAYRSFRVVPNGHTRPPGSPLK